MDAIRMATEASEELSMRQLSLRIAQDAGIDDKHDQAKLYDRVRPALRQLRDAGLVKLTTIFHPTQRVNVTLVTLTPIEPTA